MCPGLCQTCLIPRKCRIPRKGEPLENCSHFGQNCLMLVATAALVLGPLAVSPASSDPVPPLPGPVSYVLNQTAPLDPILGPVLYYVEHFDPNANMTEQAASLNDLVKAISLIVHSGICISFSPGVWWLSIGQQGSIAEVPGIGETWQGLRQGTYSLTMNPNNELRCLIPV
jgi:hypothetical protein